ncbi:MAG: hypothetical protein HGB26_08260 [Desulfobulbaceae bacterium]|nr:hypothetical protein [Desulfobulbaceae bacterium]
MLKLTPNDYARMAAAKRLEHRARILRFGASKLDGDLKQTLLDEAQKAADAADAIMADLEAKYGGQTQDPQV